MTNEERQALIAACEDRIAALDHYCRKNPEDTFAANDFALMKIAFNSLTADPVAYVMGEEAISDFKQGYEFFAVRDDDYEEELDILPLYTAPPVPDMKAVKLPEVAEVQFAGRVTEMYIKRHMDEALRAAGIEVEG